MSRLDEVLGTAILKGKKALGKEAPEVLRLPLDLLRVRGQPRRRFENLEALAESIREKGVLQPLLVRRVGEAYEAVAGERRLRAAARRRPKASSAAERVLASGTFTTRIPRRLAASRSTLSTPTPPRPTTLRRFPLWRSSASTRVRLRVMKAS